eukprot:15484103-Alexandrium_andersonii.AAC.2
MCLVSFSVCQVRVCMCARVSVLVHVRVDARPRPCPSDIDNMEIPRMKPRPDRYIRLRQTETVFNLLGPTGMGPRLRQRPRRDVERDAE